MFKRILHTLFILMCLFTISSQQLYGQDITKQNSSNSTSCCVDIRGNVDSDAQDITDISDLIFLMGIVFEEKEMVCYEETDIDKNSFVELADVIYLAQFMFQNGPEPSPCHDSGNS